MLFQIFPYSIEKKFHFYTVFIINDFQQCCKLIYNFTQLRRSIGIKHGSILMFHYGAENQCGCKYSTLMY